MEKSKVMNDLRRIIRNFIVSVGREAPDIHAKSDLNEDIGLSSDEGVCIVLDISAELGLEIPDDFNAIVHDDGSRARTFEELADRVMCFGGKS